MPETPTREALHGACPCFVTRDYGNPAAQAKCRPAAFRKGCKCAHGTIQCRWKAHAIIDSVFSRLEAEEKRGREECCGDFKQYLTKQIAALERENAELRKERR